jgi:hypothetical protein
LDDNGERGAGVLIDCDTCTVRGEGCADCVVTVLLGAPPGWQAGGPTVVPLTRRPRAGGGGDDQDVPGAAPATRGATAASATEAPTGERAGTLGVDTPDAPERGAAGCEEHHVDSAAVISRPVVELDDVERRAVRALADFGLVPPLRHQDASLLSADRRSTGDRHVS